MYREREPQGGRGEPQGWDGGSRGGEREGMCVLFLHRGEVLLAQYLIC